MTDERLELRYIPLTQARRWDENPKRHALDALVRSIETHGFGDPPKLDSTLGALVYGNGRTEALERMRQAGKEPPRGIGVTEDGDWAVPVIFGVDAESRAAAVAFALDHNNLTLLGGGLSVEDLLQIWDEEALQRVLGDVPDAGALLASLDAADLDALLQGPGFEPVSADDQSRLDEKAPIVCPSCGEEIPR
jgi:ParB-like chromosome segregation protein Spo0J